MYDVRDTKNAYFVSSVYSMVCATYKINNFRHSVISLFVWGGGGGQASGDGYVIWGQGLFLRKKTDRSSFLLSNARMRRNKV